MVKLISISSTLHSNQGKPMVDPSLLAHIKELGMKLKEINIKELGLTPGVELRLRNSNIHTIEQLCACNNTDLLDLYEVGPGRVDQIKRNLNSLLSGMLSQADQLQKENSEIAVSFAEFIQAATQLCGFFEKVRPLDEIHLPYNVRNTLSWVFNEKVETLADLQRLTKTVVICPQFVDGKYVIHPTTADLAATIESIETLLKYRNIDDEMADLFRCVTDRERFVLLNRYGVRKRLTLDQIGKKENICRERARQIERKAQRKLARQVALQSSLLYSTDAIIVLKRLAQDATFDLWKQKLLDIGFLQDETSLDLLVVMCRTTSNSLFTLPGEIDNVLETRVAPRIIANRKRILAKAVKLCRNSGAVRAESLKDDSLSEMDVEQILRLGQFIKVQSGWWMRETSGSVPKRIAKKVIANCGPLSADNIVEALRRHLLRSELPSPPSDVLLKILISTGDFVLMDGFINLTSGLVRRFSLTPPEQSFCQLIREEGPVVPFESIYNRLLRDGFSMGTVTGLLRFSPIVHRIAMGLYTLLGNQYDAEDIDSARSKVTKVPSEYNIRPHSNGVVDFETNVGTWGIYGGVINCGPAVAMEGNWKLMSEGVKIGEIIVGGGFIRGLSDIIEDLELVAIDRIRIEFNTWTREAEIKKYS